MKKNGIITLIVAAVAIFLLFRLCSSNLGSIIGLPGSTGDGSSTESSGRLNPRGNTNDATVNGSAWDDMDIKDLERELGVGTDRSQTTTTTTNTQIPSSTPSSSDPLTFKGIPMNGTLSSFGTELVKAGFKSAGNGTYTGDFAGYSGCKVTPSGSNPVQEVRVDFPVISDWSTLEKAYDNLQADLTRKYGIEPKTSTDNNLAVYELPNGTISLDADVSNRSTWHVILTYSNAQAITLNPSSGRNPIDDL